MTNVTITNPNSAYQGTISNIRFVDGVATADDTTPAGKALIAFAKRRGWKRGSTAATVQSVDAGKPLARWTIDELKTYLTVAGVKFPSNAPKADLLAVAQTAYETRAQGGSAAIPAAGHTQGTFPVLGAPDVPGDDESKSAQYEVPVISPAGDGAVAAPTVTTQPADVGGADGTTASFTIGGAGVPEPTIQWQKAESGSPTSFSDVAGATGNRFTIQSLATSDRGDKYRAVLTNTSGTATSNAATVLAAV